MDGLGPGVVAEGMVGGGVAERGRQCLVGESCWCMNEAEGTVAHLKKPYVTWAE